MIPFQAALVAWILVSMLLMADRDNARGFSLAVVLGMLILPAGYDMNLPGVPDLEKDNVAGIGILLGTIVFHPHLFDRFRLSILDFLLLFVMLATIVTSYLGNFGMYDGVSRSTGFLLNFVLIVFLARIHLGTPRSLRVFLLTLFLASVAYAPLALWEFRMSPQIHTQLYGYFQHVFQQHFRGGFWRPIICFSHALALGRFFAFTAFLGALPLRHDLIRIFGGWGGLLFLAPLLGLALSQSLGPYFMFVLLCVGYAAVRRQPWTAYVLPVAAFVWAAFVFMGFKPGYEVVENVETFEPQRAQSLNYRLEALQEYRSVVLFRPWFGYGGWGQGRIEGRATDSQLLIQLIRGGFVTAAAYFCWWFVALRTALRVKRRTHGTVLARRALAIAVLCSVSLAVTVIDAALDLHLIIAVSALLPIDVWLSRNPRIPTLEYPYVQPLAPNLLGHGRA